MNAVVVDHLTALETLPPETPLTLTDVSWDEYVRIADEIGERPGVRVTYDQRRLEIMTLLPEHEGPSRLFTHLISVIVEETGSDYISLGSTALRSRVIEGGVEADYAGLKVKELWRCDGKKVEFYSLSCNRYVEIASSDLFPFLTPDILPDFLEQGLKSQCGALSVMG